MVTLSDVVKQLKVNNSTVEKTNKHLEDYFKSVERSRLDQLEALRESNKGGGAAGAIAAGGDTKTSGGSIATLMAGIAALVAGFFTGILDSVKSLFKLTQLDKLFNSIKGLFTTQGAIGKLFASFSAKWTTLIDDAVKVIDDLIQPIKNLFSNFKTKTVTAVDNGIKVIDDLIQPVKNLFTSEGRIAQLFKTIAKPFMFPFEGFIDEVAKPFKALFTAGEGGTLSKIFSTITRPFTAATTFVSDLVKPITTFFSAEGPIGKIFTTVKQAFSFADEGSALMKMLGGIGKVLGKLFLPVTIIMTAWDTIKGAMAGYEEDGIIGMLEGAWTGLLNSLIGVPLDLLKSGVSWIAGKMGFSEAEKILDSFSFEDLISKAVGGLFDVIKYSINSLLETAATIVGVFSDKSAEKIRSYKFDMSEKTGPGKPKLGPALEVNDFQEPGAFTIPSKPGQSAARESYAAREGVRPVSFRERARANYTPSMQQALAEQRSRTQAAAAQPTTPTVISSGGNTTSNVSQNTTNMISSGMPATRDRNDSYQQY